MKRSTAAPGSAAIDTFSSSETESDSLWPTPTLYTVSYSFGGFQANAPTTPLPGASLDNELANIVTAIASIGAAVKDIRRSDGKLNNGVVTFDSFEQGLQLLIDPTNGQLVAAAVATAQAAQTAASGSATAAAGSAASALTQALAAAASAATVNLSLYLAKANNLAGLGSLVTARANLGLGTVATSNIGIGAGNIPQIDGNGKLGPIDGSQLINIDTVPVGALMWLTGTNAPTGFIKANGALVGRASLPRLWTFANASGNIVSEASWSGGSSGAFSTGDIATTFRVPDARGEFIRAWDDGRGVDSGRGIGSNQADGIASHTHPVAGLVGTSNQGIAAGGSFTGSGGSVGTSATAQIGGLAETRPRNIPLLACIKF